jgi:20S proteasome subunit beta 7
MFSTENNFATMGPIWQNGPTPGNFYNFPGNSAKQVKNENQINGYQRSSQPITTGTSIVAVKYDSGVIIAGDLLVSYGNLARFHNVDRVFQINKNIILGVSGDYADFQYIHQIIQEKVNLDISMDDNNVMKPKALYSYLTRFMYNRRSNFNPLWLDIVVGGMENEEPFLGHINVRGRSYTNNVVATGFGIHLALPILREFSEKQTLDKAKAEELVKKSMEVLFYRDCRGYPKFSQAIISLEGCTITKHDVSQNWEVAHMIKGY